MPLPAHYNKEKVSELACTYAALLLHDEKIQIDATKIKTVVSAAGIDVEPYWPPIFAKFLTGKNVSELLVNIGGSAAPTAAAATSESGAPAAAKEESKKKEESESEEEDDDAFGGLF